jgi:DNA-directed RNA polymerase subunit RPC12/RpoP
MKGISIDSEEVRKAQEKYKNAKCPVCGAGYNDFTIDDGGSFRTGDAAAHCNKCNFIAIVKIKK